MWSADVDLITMCLYLRMLSATLALGYVGKCVFLAMMVLSVMLVSTSRSAN